MRASGPQRRPAGRRAGLVAGLLAALLAGLLSAPPGLAAVPGPPPGPPAPDGRTLGPDRRPGCAAVVAAMSPRARLAQRLVVGVDASDPRGTAETVRETQVGGVFLGGTATALLRDQALRGVQAAARIPLLVAVDDEGGRVQRVDDLDGELPSARRMSALSAAEVRELGRHRGRALAARGVTTNLAPTVDVGRQRAGAVIGDRSFGADPRAVVDLAGAFAEGQREAGIDVVLKHFPGHGRADGDSHRGRVSTPSLADLRASDLVPYAALVGPGGPLADGRTGVMVGHLDVPGLTAGLPSSLTPAVYRLLREQYGFDGPVITDDLGAMRAVTGSFALPEAVARALGAGADVALWTGGGGVAAVLDELERELAAGTLDAPSNDRAVTRVLIAKGTCSARS